MITYEMLAKELGENLLYELNPDLEDAFCAVENAKGGCGEITDEDRAPLAEEEVFACEEELEKAEDALLDALDTTREALLKHIKKCKRIAAMLGAKETEAAR
ncbi:MAG TPA: hypothetical protein VGJ20_46785 [Xanthobacteraceae bacterium]